MKKTDRAKMVLWEDDDTTMAKNASVEENQQTTLQKLQERVERLEYYTYPEVPEKEYTMAEAIKEGLDFEYKDSIYRVVNGKLYSVVKADYTGYIPMDFDKLVYIDWILEHQNEKVKIVG